MRKLSDLPPLDQRYHEYFSIGISNERYCLAGYTTVSVNVRKFKSKTVTLHILYGSVLL